MRNNVTVLSWLIMASFIVAFVLPFVSWLIWSFGLPVESLLSSEGLRWLFLHSIANSFDNDLFFCVLAISALGVWLRVIPHPTIISVRRRAVLICLFVGLLLVSVASFAAFHPDSPLLSINGTIVGSPLSHGALPFLCNSIILLGIIYGFVVGAIRSLDTFVDVLVSGVRKYAPWLLLYLLVSFDAACMEYIFF